jgi:hypothetical protein
VSKQQQYSRGRAQEIRRAWGMCRQQATQIAREEWEARERFYKAIIAREHIHEEPNGQWSIGVRS